MTIDGPLFDQGGTSGGGSAGGGGKSDKDVQRDDLVRKIEREKRETSGSTEEESS